MKASNVLFFALLALFIPWQVNAMSDDGIALSADGDSITLVVNYSPLNSNRVMLAKNRRTYCEKASGGELISAELIAGREKYKSSIFRVPDNARGPIVLKFKNPSSFGKSAKAMVILYVESSQNQSVCLFPSNNERFIFFRKKENKLVFVVAFEVEGTIIRDVVDRVGTSWHRVTKKDWKQRGNEEIKFGGSWSFADVIRGHK